MKPTESDMDVLLKRIRIDPIWFCREMLNVEPEPWQAQLLEAVADIDRAKYGLPTKRNHQLKLRFTITSGHSAGKTFGLCLVLLWFQISRVGLTPITGPRFETLKTRTFPTLRKILAGSTDFIKSIAHVDITKAYFYGNIDHVALIESVTDPQNLAGLHHDNLMFMVDEASAVNEAMWPVIAGALATSGAIMILIGNPSQVGNYFHASHTSESEAKYFYRMALKPGDSQYMSSKWIKEMAERYGINSAIYKVRVLGEFVEDSENQLLATAWWQAAHRDIGPEYSTMLEPGFVLSCDVAGGGKDDTVVILAYVYDDTIHVARILEYNYPLETAVADTRETVARIFDANKTDDDAATSDYIVIDSNGVGDGASAELVKAGYPVMRYKGGTKSDDGARWRNRRVQSYMMLRDAVRDGRLFIAPDACSDDQWVTLLKQSASIQVDTGTERLEDLETKTRMISRGIDSPDYIDALSMLFATMNIYNTGGGVQAEAIESEHNNFDEEF